MHCSFLPKHMQVSAVLGSILLFIDFALSNMHYIGRYPKMMAFHNNKDSERSIGSSYTAPRTGDFNVDNVSTHAPFISRNIAIIRCFDPYLIVLLCCKYLWVKDMKVSMQLNCVCKFQFHIQWIWKFQKIRRIMNFPTCSQVKFREVQEIFNWTLSNFQISPCKTYSP